MPDHVVLFGYHGELFEYFFVNLFQCIAAVTLLKTVSYTHLTLPTKA